MMIDKSSKQFSLKRSLPALRSPQASVPFAKPVGRCPASRRRAVAVSAQRIDIKPFSGCNCFYLLAKSKEGYLEGRDLVLRTLKQIKEVGFTVVRTWAYQDDPDPNMGGTLQYKDPTGKITYDEKMLNGLTWLLEQCQEHELQLMLCLTNGNPKEFGGMRQYVRWARGIPNKHEGGREVLNKEFFDDPIAQQLYKNYVTDIIHKYKDHPAVHSWDLANEPRCQGDVSCEKMNSWIADTAQFVKTLDNKHPITVGVDGFFGASTPDLSKDASYNPYWGERNPSNEHQWAIDGCDFVGNFKSSDIDFASIHLYPTNWGISDAPNDHRIEWSKKWINDHINVCKDPEYGLNNIPLVLQEYNLPAKDGHDGHQRRDFFQALSDLLQSQVETGIFIGSMVWCMADPSQAGDPEDSSQYYMYARSVSKDNNAISHGNDSQVKILEDLSKKINPPRSGT